MAEAFVCCRGAAGISHVLVWYLCRVGVGRPGPAAWCGGCAGQLTPRPVVASVLGSSHGGRHGALALAAAVQQAGQGGRRHLQCWGGSGKQLQGQLQAPAQQTKAGLRCINTCRWPTTACKATAAPPSASPAALPGPPRQQPSIHEQLPRGRE